MDHVLGREELGSDWADLRIPDLLFYGVLHDHFHQTEIFLSLSRMVR